MTRKFRSMNVKQSLFLVLFLLNQSLCVWALFFRMLHFCGHFLISSTPGSSGGYHKLCWSMLGQDMKLPLLFQLNALNSRMNEFLLLYSRWEEKLFSLSQNWEHQDFVSWQEGDTSSTPKFFCHTILSLLHIYPHPHCHGWRPQVAFYI